jgi:PPOX class probable F420-dependent enzyme
VAFTLDTSTEYGSRVARHLDRDTVVWLTTVDRGGTPQPVPVWFMWTGSQFLVFSQPDKPKLRNIDRNDRVALNFRGTERGGDLVIFTGRAAVDSREPTDDEQSAYNAKYAADMRRIGVTAEAFAQEYSVPIRITPEKLRGF